MPNVVITSSKESVMTTNYNEIAEEYKRAKQQPWRLHIEHFTLSSCSAT
jgi:hypothetical protein